MIFEFRWDECGDGSSYLFEGPEKTKEEFEADCKKAMIECFSDYIASVEEDSWAGLGGWICFAAERLEKFGYKMMFPVSFGYYGYTMPRKCDENSYKDIPELKKQMKKIERHNNRLDKLLYD